ncbi:STAS domain-containing protein [Streptomyces flavofungini]|uniref:STAS domain-containing protein n=1 Tax=Streptomyces flavofungini TaxID=68200 RepID=A0ABS0XH91_9ACTN|nr:STAS domain-containing protein [Streptomyces flavofungini]
MVCVQDVRPHGDCTLVVLCGEIDIHTAPAISWQLDDLTPNGGADLLVDLRAVEFMDCAGVRLFDRARTRARMGGPHGRLRLICTRPASLHLLKHPRLRLGFDILDQLPAPVPPQAVS